MLGGLYDEGVTLYGNPATTFPVFKALRAQVLRLNLHWAVVARSRPANPIDPNDSAYDWAPYDQAVQYASKYGLQVLCSTIHPPGGANGVPAGPVFRAT